MNIARVFQQGYFSSQVTITYAIMDNMVYLIIYISFDCLTIRTLKLDRGYMWIGISVYLNINLQK